MSCAAPSEAAAKASPWATAWAKAIGIIRNGGASSMAGARVRPERPSGGADRRALAATAHRARHGGLNSPRQLFSRQLEDVWLEIGFGGGEHLVWQAAAHPDIGFIGCEAYVNGIAKLLSAVEDQGLDNIRIHDGDARELVSSLGEGSIGRIFLLFPDPWPKRRHHKRRIITSDMLAQFHRILRPGGVLRFASDSGDYVAWTLIHIRAHGGFAWLADAPPDWRERPPDWPETRYEAKARRAGRRRRSWPLSGVIRPT
jgi:tRNA (guanine-N7-)-methyltransferase